MIKIIDYGLGNVSSFLNVYKFLNIECELAANENDLHSATHIILPGVGSFDFAMDLFLKSGLKPRVESLIFEKNIPLLGVCVGMQILGDESEEGHKDGLGWIPGKIKKIRNASDHNLPLPHMGWNGLLKTQNEKLFKNVDLNKGFYFLHSYFFDSNKYSIASCSYPDEFCCSVQNKNIYGVQFHPEKSLSNGISLLKNFSEI
tara:strand:- start:12 stop:617 length:606 start_codon:yes stop_codon:yes gene_type:complete